MKALKKPEVDLKLKYRKTFELSLIISIVIHLGFFHAFPEIDLTERQVQSQEIKIEVADIPVTEQVKRMPPPPRPSIPIPTESEEIPEDLTIESTKLDLATLPPPPPPREDRVEDGYVFVSYDEPPVPIGGYEAILRNLRYPELARQAGIEGVVVVGVLIDEQGNAIKTQVLKQVGAGLGLEEAAQAAVMATTWKAAKQRDHAVKVWVSIPIRFRLKNEEPKVAS